jgi:hypothetical protein
MSFGRRASHTIRGLEFGEYRILAERVRLVLRTFGYGEFSSSPQ